MEERSRDGLRSDPTGTAALRRYLPVPPPSTGTAALLGLCAGRAEAKQKPSVGTFSNRHGALAEESRGELALWTLPFSQAKTVRSSIGPTRVASAAMRRPLDRYAKGGYRRVAGRPAKRSHAPDATPRPTARRKAKVRGVSTTGPEKRHPFGTLHNGGLRRLGPRGARTAAARPVPTPGLACGGPADSREPGRAEVRAGRGLGPRQEASREGKRRRKYGRVQVFRPSRSSPPHVRPRGSETVGSREPRLGTSLVRSVCYRSHPATWAPHPQGG